MRAPPRLRGGLPARLFLLFLGLFMIGIVRATIEVAGLAVGITLGGTFGFGTVAFALGIGPAVEASFWLLERSPSSVAK